ncbi:MAG: phosphopantetheine-protein transferase [candidate division NC10 bacterium]|nr:phosphopantetheine-protein transferase [candidate division NC10 bacterium]
MEPILDAWNAPPGYPVLTRADVHVWKSALNPPMPLVRDLERLLAPEERDRADRFGRAEDRRRFTVGRGVLRTILGRYLGREPDQLHFRYNPSGKPGLSAETGSHSIRFNVSHTRDIALHAVTIGREIGVDIERIRADIGTEEIAARIFSAREVAALCALPHSSRLEAFFTCWTRKEAYLKARGEGLSLPLDRFTVSLAPGHPAALLEVLDDPEETTRWSLRQLFPGADHVAALAVEGCDWRLKCWQWGGYV